MAVHEVLLSHTSLKWTKSQRSRRRAVLAALAHQPHFNGFTELGDDNDLATAAAAVEEAGYLFVGDRAWEGAIAVRPDVTDLTFWAVQAHGPGREGRRKWRARDVVCARGLVAPDVDLTVAEFHSVTWTGGSPERRAAREAMARTTADQLTSSGVGRRLAVAMGDSNEADAPGAEKPQAKIFDEAGVTSVWDDLGKYPPTMDDHTKRGPIDWVLRRKADRRLTFTNVEVVDQRDSDHHQILVHALVRVREPEPEPHVCPVKGCGFLHLPGGP